MVLPWALSSSAGNIIGDWDRDLPQLEVHDKVGWEMLLPDSMVAKLGTAGDFEDLRDWGTDELEGVVFIAS